MSKNYASKEEAMSKLYATIKSKFEQDGVLNEVRCMLQSKMVAMMKGKNETSSPLLPQNHCSAGDQKERDARLQLLHQLIMEYFHWHGFYYSAEMFALEGACDNSKPVRECLEGVLGGTYEHKELPILLELVTNLMEKKK